MRRQHIFLFNLLFVNPITGCFFFYQFPFEFEPPEQLSWRHPGSSSVQPVPPPAQAYPPLERKSMRECKPRQRPKRHMSGKRNTYLVYQERSNSSCVLLIVQPEEFCPVGFSFCA